jgi:coenzyme F420-reducing hydrogenase alpha subunit
MTQASTIKISPITRIEGHASIGIRLDDNGLITRANLIVGTTHNLGPINMSVDQAARTLIKDGVVNEGILNKVEMAVRAYDP